MAEFKDLLADHYVAKGFQEDADNLLKEFVDLKSVKFSDFAPIWRRHHFSLIYMGRPDDAELCEFTNEIFRLTTQYLSSASYYLRVGAVYLLYALFRNQIIQPPVMIRITLEQWEVIKTLFEESIEKKYATLYYVINFLRENALLFVANQTLRGPLVGIIPEKEGTSNQLTNYKSSLLEYSANNHLGELVDIYKQYLEAKNELNTNMRIAKTDLSKFYIEKIKEMHEIVKPDENNSENLGERRAKIKAEAFKKKSKNRLGITSDDEGESATNPESAESESATNRRAKIEAEAFKKSKNRLGITSDDEGATNPGDTEDYDYLDIFTRRIRPQRARRPPKHERRVGRPSTKPKIEEKKSDEEEKKSDDEDLNLDRLLLQQNDLYMPPVNYEVKKCRSKRFPYYQTSPKHEDSDSSD